MDRPRASLFFILGFVALLLVSTGCGDDESAEGPATEGPPDAASEIETAPSPTRPPQRFDPDEEVEIEPPSEVSPAADEGGTESEGEESAAADAIERARAEELARQSGRNADPDDID